MAHQYTNEQRQFIKENVTGRTCKELTALVNAEFGIQLSEAVVNSYKKNHGLKSGLSGQFKPGRTPVNKGKKYPGLYKNSGQFQVGRKPKNYMPVGSERVNADGYVDIKISDPNKWRAKHKLVWEEVNGPIPAGKVVMFADGNNRNFDIDNLLCVTKRKMLTLNKHKLISTDADLTRTGLLIADVYEKMADRKRK